MSSKPVLAVDIGGTKIAATLVEPGGRMGLSLRADTPRDSQRGGEGMWRTLTALLDRLLERGGADVLAGVGVGCSGPMSWPDGRVSPLNIPAWRDFPLRARLSERFPGLPVRVHNDAVCMAVGEHWRGSGRGQENVLGIVVSTGVGGGLVLGGRLINGASGNAGHIGHVVVDPGGPECACGGRGCLEAVARGYALTAWAHARGWRRSSTADARDLAEDARRGHPVAQDALRRAGAALGVAITSATYLCDLDVVAIGGGLSQAGAVLFDPLYETLGEHLGMDFVQRVRVVPASLGQEAGLVGAAALVLAEDRYWDGDRLPGYCGQGGSGQGGSGQGDRLPP